MSFTRKRFSYAFFIFSVVLSFQLLHAGLDIDFTSHVGLHNNIFGYCLMPSKVFKGLYSWWFKPDLTRSTRNQLNIISFLPIKGGSAENVVGVNENNVGRDEIIKLLKKKNKTRIFDINGNLYKICNGVPNEIKNFSEPINLYLGGFSNSTHPHAFSLYKGIKEGTMHGPCIVFECATDTRRTFNFCQEQDLQCVDLVYKDLLEKHPEAQIILRGGCKGAAVYLHFLAEKTKYSDNDSLKNIKACVANYPPLSVKNALKDIRYGGALGYWFCRLVLPNYNPHAKTILDATAFPQDIPVLFSCLPKNFDRICDLDDMKLTMEHLEKLGARIEFFVSKGFAKDNGKKIKLGHGKLGRAKDYQRRVQTFLKDKRLLNS